MAAKPKTPPPVNSLTKAQAKVEHKRLAPGGIPGGHAGFERVAVVIAYGFSEE